MPKRQYLDKRRTKFLAGLIGLTALTAMAFVTLSNNKTDTAGHALMADAASVQLTPCQLQRQSDVNKMRENGAISDDQYQQFLERALARCPQQ